MKLNAPTYHIWIIAVIIGIIGIVSRFTSIAYASQYSFEWVKTNFINLVCELESTGRLPTLCFVLDRVECEELYLKLLSDLEYLQDKKKQFEMGQMNTKEMEIERRRRAKQLAKLRKNKPNNMKQKIDKKKMKMKIQNS